jgi:hypothetical protein
VATPFLLIREKMAGTVKHPHNTCLWKNGGKSNMCWTLVAGKLAGKLYMSWTRVFEKMAGKSNTHWTRVCRKLAGNQTCAGHVFVEKWREIKHALDMCL